MVNPIPYFARDVWSKWGIQIVILTSFYLQIILTLLGYLRKKGFKRNISFVFLWISYLVADSTATFCIGLIASKYGDKDTQISNVNDLLLAFWAPFLLLHLGGPDTITAYSLEDNQLWLRHLLGLLVQVCLTGYVFLLTIPNNPLWLPTSLVFVAGMIKFGERTRSLQLASHSKLRVLSNMSHFQVHYITKASSDDNEKEEISDVMVVMRAYRYLNKFKGHHSIRLSNSERRIFGEVTLLRKQTAIDAFRIVEVELELLYQTFYTKASAIYNKVGFCFRFLSLALVVAALLLFVFDQKRGCDEFDVKVTYTLLCGAVAMDVVSFLMLIFSNHFFGLFYHQINEFDDSKKPFSGFLKLKRRGMWKEGRFRERRYKILCSTTLGFKWSYSISGFNLISYCLHKRESLVDKVIDNIGGKELVEKMKYEKERPLLQNLWIFIFTELQRKSRDPPLFQALSCRGDWVIRKGGLPEDAVNTLMPYVESSKVTFDECVIMWHIATDLLFYYEGEDVENGRDECIVPKDGQDFEFRDFSKILSDYILYLLVMQPSMMSSSDKEPGDHRFKNTCDAAIKFFKEKKMTGKEDKEEKETRKSTKKRKACKELSDMQFHDNPYLLSGAKLANDIKKLQGMNKWKMIAQVWVELLLYTAFNSPLMGHVQQLGTGTEFVSDVWLLIINFGINY